MLMLGWAASLLVSNTVATAATLALGLGGGESLALAFRRCRLPVDIDEVEHQRNVKCG